MTSLPNAASVPVRVSQVENQVDTLRETLHKVDEFVTLLQPTFTRVLCSDVEPLPPENLKPSVPSAPLVPLANELLLLVDIAASIKRKLQSILDRSEV